MERRAAQSAQLPRVFEVNGSPARGAVANVGVGGFDGHDLFCQLMQRKSPRTRKSVISRLSDSKLRRYTSSGMWPDRSESAYATPAGLICSFVFGLSQQPISFAGPLSWLALKR